MAGGGACLDAVGYHPYGFLADYDVAPDVVNPGVDPLTDPRACPNGFCFRGAEKIYEIMQQQGLGDKKVWATEFGWITRPPDECLSDPILGRARVANRVRREAGRKSRRGVSVCRGALAVDGRHVHLQSRFQ